MPIMKAWAPKRVLTAPISDQGMGIMKARIGQNLPVGNEGAGTVVLTGR